MKLDLNYNKHVITFNNEEIEVYEEISTKDKIAIIAVAIEESLKYGSVPSRIAFEATLGALMCFKYSNIEVEDLGNKDVLDDYDIFVNSGFLPTLMNEIDKDDYAKLIKYADQAFETALVYYNSGASVLETTLKLGLLEAANKVKNK